VLRSRKCGDTRARNNSKVKDPSGPFLIEEEQKGLVNCKLKLPGTMKIHPVLHISLLEQ